MTGLKSNLFTQFETCILRHDISDASQGIVKRSGVSSLRGGERGSFDGLCAQLGSSGWEFKSISNDQSGEAWIFSRALPGPY